MTYGFRRLFLQSMGALCLLCGLIGLGRQMENAAMQAAAISPQQSGVTLPVLMYHSVLKDSSRWGKYVLSPDALDADLQYLKNHGYEAVTISDLLSYLDDGTALPEKSIMITFDDGYYNNYVYAYPILQKYKMRAVISVIGSETATYTESGQENAYWSHLTLYRLQEMQDVFEIENHSWNLHEYGERRGCLRKQGEAEDGYTAFFHTDTEQTQRMLTDAGLPTPQCYTYPFGACSEESEVLLKSMGFRCTLGCTEKTNYITSDPACLYQLGRFNRPSGESTETFMKRVLGSEET